MGNTQYVKVTEMSTIEMLTCAQKGRQVELLPRKNEMGNFFFFFHFSESVSTTVQVRDKVDSCGA